MCSCPVCGDASTTPWLEVPDTRSKDSHRVHRIHRCEACDYGFLAPRPTLEEVRGFYPDDYYTHGPVDASAAARPSFLDRLLINLAWRFDEGTTMLDSLRERCVGAPRACDVGCGGGKLLGAMRDAGADVVGVEMDGMAREFARSQGLPVLEGTAEHLPLELEPGTFDLVSMSHVLEHCIDPIASIKNVACLLKPSGHLMIEVPNNECLGLKRSGIAWRWLDAPRHLNFFTRKSLVVICHRVGLKVDEVKFVGYTRQFHPAWTADEDAHRRTYAAFPGVLRIDPRIGSTPSRWGLLLATARAPECVKYDSVRVLARWPS